MSFETNNIKDQDEKMLNNYPVFAAMEVICR